MLDLHIYNNKQTEFVKVFFITFILSTELLEDKQRFKLGGVDTSPSYLLFHTLLPLFWTLTCMIWMELTRTDAVFKRIAMVLFLGRNNSMAVLLKTAPVRVSSIQIMQVRVQNKGKNVWKSRYDGDVSWILTIFITQGSSLISPHFDWLISLFSLHLLIWLQTLAHVVKSIHMIHFGLCLWFPYVWCA